MFSQVVNRRVVSLFFLLVISGCNKESILEKLASPEDQAFAKHYIELLRSQAFEEIEKAADPSIGDPDLRLKLEKMAASIPPGQPRSVKLVGAQRWQMNDSSTVNTTFEYEFSDQWVLVNVAVKKQNATSTLVGFNVSPQNASVEEQNRFRLEGKTAGQYMILVSAVASSLLTLYALVLCLRTTITGRKWPWILFILLGFGKVAVNWSTAQITFEPLSVQLFSAGAYSPLYGQWTLAVSLPIGAIMFLVKRKRLLEQPA